MLERLIRIVGPHDLRGTVWCLEESGLSWPTARWIDGVLHKATSTPEGPATLALAGHPEGVFARAWGPGADWALGVAPRWVGADDDPSGFVPAHPVIAEARRRNPGLRLASTGRVWDTLVGVILGQKVTGKGAGESRKGLWLAHGEPAPGPVDLRLPPSPATLKTLAYYDLHPFNIERKRADILLHAARVANRLEETTSMGFPEAWARLTAVRGIGPWTAALVAGVALGDPDAVHVGDYHLKNAVAWGLAGEPRGTDERMLELLAPYAGQRRRAIQYLGAAGVQAPRYGPRLSIRDVRDQ